MNVKCKYCKSKYRLTVDAYNDMDYLGRHIVKCKFCLKTFDVIFDGYKPIAVKHSVN